MTHRTIEGLRWAELCSKPSWVPRSRPRGSKAAGLAYERSVARSIPAAMTGLWFAYADRGGPGWCAPDMVLQTPWGVLVIEAKLTDVPEAYTQVRKLYMPVLDEALNQRVLGIVICRGLTPQRYGQVTESLSEALAVARGGIAIPTLHWPGRHKSALLLPFKAQSSIPGLAQQRAIA